MSVISIIMPTYNHGRYIAEAIESVLMQETEYQYELLINDDCSTDDTRSIAESYSSKFPDRIKLIYPEANQGLIKSYKRLMDVAEGKYIAILESDDVWTDKKKLQKQVDFLEAHPDYSLVVGDYTRIDQDGKLIEPMTTNIDKGLHGDWYEELLYKDFVGALTICFRRSTFNRHCDMEDYISRQFMTFDYPLLLSLAAHSKCHYIHENLANYRVIETSISNSADYRKRIAFEDSVCDIQDYILQRFGRHNLDEFRFNESRAKKYVERALKFNQVSDFIKYARNLRSHEFKYKMLHYFPLLWYLQHKLRGK